MLTLSSALLQLLALMAVLLYAGHNVHKTHTPCTEPVLRGERSEPSPLTPPPQSGKDKDR